MADPKLIHDLQHILQDLTDNPYPDLPNPEGLQKRASVALIIRLNPSYSHWPEDSPHSQPTTLSEFFSSPWTTHSTPELLFIKRAARKGDRWTSHIALPGGKRDPSDSSDQYAAVRETSEEVGIDLNTHAIPCGNLPQRLVTTHWGKKPLLVLCPYVFLMTSHNIPPMKLQPTEVASVHWVPLSSLRDPERRTVVLEDVSARLARQETGAARWLLSTILGKMVFAAISLEPSESLHSRLETDTLQDNRFARHSLQSTARTLVTRIWRADLFGQFSETPRKEGPLLLWGLTLGVISDFLDLVPPGDALDLWTYPTFTPLDVRFLIWLFTYRFKERKRSELQSGAEFNHNISRRGGKEASFGGAAESVRITGLDGSTECSIPAANDERPNETGFHGLGTGLRKGKYKSTVQSLLEGWVDHFASLVLPSCADRSRYYELVRRAIWVALVGRLGLGVLGGMLLWRRLGKGRVGVWGRGMRVVGGGMPSVGG